MCKVLRFLVMVLLAPQIGLCGITTAFAEIEEKVIVLSDRVGEVIDAGERERFELFQGIQGFKSAVCLQLPDGSYVVEVTYVKEGEEAKRKIEQSERDIEMLRDYIEHYEEIIESKEARQVFDEKWSVLVPEKPPLPEIKIGTPPLSSARIAGEVLGGAAGGCLFGAAGFGIGILVAPEDKDMILDMQLVIGLIGFAIGYPIGSAIGVYSVGNTGDETGSFWATLGGSIVGVLVGGASALSTRNGVVTAVVLVAGPPIGATIGFNMTRRYKTPSESGSSLINFRDGQLSLAFPAIYFKPNPIDGKTLVQNVDLVTVRF